MKTVSSIVKPGSAGENGLIRHHAGAACDPAAAGRIFTPAARRPGAGEV